MSRFSVGSFVIVKDTGRVGKVLERRAQSVLVGFPEHGQEEAEKKRIAESMLEPFAFPELDRKSVRAVVRGEKNITELTHGLDTFLLMKQNVKYTVTPEDLLSGLRAVKNKEKETALWLDQILYWCDEDGDIWPVYDSEQALCEDTVLLCVYDILDTARYYLSDEEWELFETQVQEAEGILETWKRVGGDVFRISEYPDVLLRFLILDLDDDNIDEKNLKTRESFKACLDALCVKGDREALYTRTFCYYHGTKPYPQNWVAARDSLLELFQGTGDPLAANALGYIYYYGRCNDGVPEYEQAFRWFSIGFAGGFYESTYKLGDLYANGYGLPKNGKTAFQLYWWVYQESLPLFLSGSAQCNFADAAIRIGNCYRDGTGCEKNPAIAYKYYLQAMMALKMRMEDGKHIGDDSVFGRLKETMRKHRESYTEQAKSMRSEVPFWLAWIIDKDHPACSLSWRKLKDGRFSLTCTRVPRTRNGYHPILVTFPEGDYCELVDKIVIKTEKDAVVTIKNDEQEIVFDEYEYSPYMRSVQLFRTGEQVGEIVTDGYTFRSVTPKNTHEE